MDSDMASVQFDASKVQAQSNNSHDYSMKFKKEYDNIQGKILKLQENNQNSLASLEKIELQNVNTPA